MPDPVQNKIEAWKARYKQDVKVTSRRIEGSYYRHQPVSWFGETAQFRVGPCFNVSEVLEELSKLHMKQKELITDATRT